MRAWQINLQTGFGGGEVFTAFLTRALSALGIPTTLIASADADYWGRLALAPDTEIVRVGSAEEVAARLPAERSWLLGHGPLPQCARQEGLHLRTAVAHMPPRGRDPRAYEGHDLVFAVSGWVLEGLRGIGAPAWDEPLYAVAEARGSVQKRIFDAPIYDFDRRKVRDRILSAAYPVLRAFAKRRPFEKRPGVTLGVVSRITPIKQFSTLFGLLAPHLVRRPQVNLEIFGAGGFASVRDLKRALAPLGDRARFWGHQDNVAAVYAQLDYLLTGLPEKEALGLNVIEAQQCGLPALAVKAPPFTETVLEGETGFFYRDPREDGGEDFARLLERVLARTERLDPRRAAAHLARFSFDAFKARVARMLPPIREKLK